VLLFIDVENPVLKMVKLINQHIKNGNQLDFFGNHSSPLGGFNE